MTKTLDIISLVLVLVGALNWGLVGIFGFNLVAFLFGTSVIATIIYILVGLAAIYEIAQLKGFQRRWACEHPESHGDVPRHPSRV